MSCKACAGALRHAPSILVCATAPGEMLNNMAYSLIVCKRDPVILSKTGDYLWTLNASPSNPENAAGVHAFAAFVLLFMTYWKCSPAA